jgi:hypothetical protein
VVKFPRAIVEKNSTIRQTRDGTACPLPAKADMRLSDRTPLLTLSCQSTANFAVVHNGPHDVVVYGRRPMGGLGETALRYEP